MALKTAQSRNFEQLTPATRWVITHDLGRTVCVDVFVPVDGSMTKILPKAVTIVDDNTVHIDFSVPYRGRARLV